MSGSTTTRKSSTTTLRLTPDERDVVLAAAASEGLGPSSFARVATLRAAGREVTPGRRRRDVLAAALTPVLGELGRHGSLLNQLAKHANSGGRVDPEALHALRNEHERLMVAVMALREGPTE